MAKRVRVLLLSLWLVLMMSPLAQAQNFALIRDSELEHFLEEIAEPIFMAAGYKKRQIKFYLIADSSINAFVNGNDIIFMHTGLISQTQSPEALASVIAHELGHILAGHVAQTMQSQAQAAKLALGTTLTALAVGLATQNVDVAVTGAIGGADTAQKNVLRSSRLRETAADQIAIDLLDQANISTRYMVEFMEDLKERESGVSYDKYLLSHPLSKDRLSYIKQQLKKTDTKTLPERKGLAEKHRRLKIKITAYTANAGDVLQYYKGQSDTARYARAIAYHRNFSYKQALEIINQLIAKYPSDAYLHELQGETFYAMQDYKNAERAYQKALKIVKFAPLIEYRLAETLANQVFAKFAKIPETFSPSEEKLFKRAQIHAYRAVNQDASIASSWKLIAKIHDWHNLAGERDLALAEHAFRLGDIGNAKKFALASQDYEQLSQSGKIRAEDILLHIKNMEQEAAAKNQ